MNPSTAASLLVLSLCFLSPTETRAEGSSLSLLNADDGSELVGSFNYVGDVLNLAQLPPRMTIVDTVFGATVGSVDFFHNGQRIRTENVVPYALGGDFPPGIFAPHELPIGPNTVRSVYYELPNRRGLALGETTVEFYVIDVDPVEFTVAPSPVLATVPAGGQSNTGFEIIIGQIDFDYDLAILSSPPFWADYPKTPQVGGNTIFLHADNLAPGTYFADPVVVQLRARDFPFVQTVDFDLVMTVEHSDAVFVSGFTFVDAVTDSDASASLFGPNSLNLFDLPPVFGVRADTYPSMVGSVVMEFAFQPNLADPPILPPPSTRIENFAPYSLFGDFPTGNYAGTPRQTGWLWIRATPYRAAHGNGSAGSPLELLVYIYPN